jgi:hypothetical protein
MGPAPSRRRITGVQYCSSAPHTGLPYCAVDSITTSCTLLERGGRKIYPISMVPLLEPVG